MKKWIAFSLSLIVCIGLYGCGVDERYAPLLKQAESGSYAGVKDELAILFPEFTEEQELLAEYADLIDALEAEDYNSAFALIESRMPAPVDPAYTVIEITMDNWQEYFYVEYTIDWQRDVFGEITALSIRHTMKLNEAYTDRICDPLETSVDIKYYAPRDTYYYVNLDLEAETYTIGEKDEGLYFSTIPDTATVSYRMQNFINDEALLANSNYLVSNHEPHTICLLEEFEIQNIQGAIHLLNE